MASVRKRGDSFTISVSLGYDAMGKQIRKFTTYTPPADVTAGKAEKLARQYAAVWEDKIRGYISLDENCTFARLCEWYFENIAPTVLKPNVFVSHKGIIDHYALPTLARKKLKEITPVMLDALFRDLQTNGRIHSLTYRLKDASLIPVGRQKEIAKGIRVGERTIYLYRQGGNAKKENAEKLAAYMGVELPSLFEAVSDYRELSVSTVLRVKNCISAILQTAVQKEIMRRNPCLNTVQLERPRPAASFLDEQQALTLLSALDKQSDFQFKAILDLVMLSSVIPSLPCVMLPWDFAMFLYASI
jgi:hypothetical protein